jgi:hypothetical protein
MPDDEANLKRINEGSVLSLARGLLMLYHYGLIDVPVEADA